MYEIKITGFTSKAQAEAFVQWYEGQGEQDASWWFECRQQEGEIDVAFMPVDLQKTYPLKWSGATLQCHLNIEVPS